MGFWTKICYIYNDSETEIEGAILFDDGADDNVSKYLSIEKHASSMF